MPYLERFLRDANMPGITQGLRGHTWECLITAFIFTLLAFFIWRNTRRLPCLVSKATDSIFGCHFDSKFTVEFQFPAAEAETVSIVRSVSDMKPSARQSRVCECCCVSRVSCTRS